MAVTWFAERQPGSSVPSAAGPVAPPFTQLASASEDGRIVVRVCPDDPAMPQLARLSDTAHLAALLGDLSAASASPPSSSPSTRSATGRGNATSNGSGWPGARGCTSRRTGTTPARGRSPPPTFLRDRVAGEAPEARVALPLGYVAEDAAAVWWNIPGAPLSRRLSSQPRGALRTVVHTGRLLRVAARQHHRADVPAGPGGADDVRAEVAETLRAGEHVAALLPDVGRTFEHAASDVVEGLDRVPG